MLDFGDHSRKFIKEISVDSVPQFMVIDSLADTPAQGKHGRNDVSLIKKSDLEYEYKWSAIDAKDDPRVTGAPDSTFLNRQEGYEILYFVNKLAEMWDLKQKASGLKIEKMIHESVPKAIRSQDKIMSWIKNNWNN